MKLPEMKDEAFLQMAREEDNCSILAGSMQSVFQKKERPAVDVSVSVTKFAFGALINLQRRKREWTIEELATRAEIDLDEALSIEEDPAYRPEPRSVYQLAKLLALPIKKLLVLSGNAELSSPKLETAAVRFAARSRAVARLSDAEATALNEFVAALAEEEDERKVS
jgi:hypothetical protein